jgi:predicted ATPase
MKILELDIKGFRSLKDVTWKPGDLNVVIGPNGAGKSNLLRLLELMAVSAQGGLSRHVQSWGGMTQLVWDGSCESITFSLNASPVEPARSEDRESLTYQLEMARIGGGSAFRIEHELLANFYHKDRGERDDPFKLLERQRMRALVFNESESGLAAPEEDLLEEESLLSQTAGPFSANRHIPPFRKELASFCVYHDLHVDKDAAIREPAVARLEKRAAPDGQNLTSVLHTLYTGDREFRKDVDLAMRCAFGDDYEELVFPPAADQKIQMRVRWKTLQREQSTADLSDGTLRFLFLLTVLASPDPAPVIAIDEPELGLHPSMLSIVAEYAVDASDRAQVILTTHSPELLDAFGDAKPTTTVAAWADGETSLKIIDGDKLEYWLKEYKLGRMLSSGELEAMA